MCWGLVLASLVGATALIDATDPPPLMSTSEALALARPVPDHRLNYGPDEFNFGELRLPEGKGPFPVVMVIHGGCWLAAYDLGYISGLAAELTRAGFATWSIEYRRVGDEGGGWPGTSNSSIRGITVGRASTIPYKRHWASRAISGITEVGSGPHSIPMEKILPRSCLE